MCSKVNGFIEFCVIIEYRSLLRKFNILMMTT